MPLPTSVSRLHWIDRFLFGPLCCLLTVDRKARHFLKRQAPPRPRSILFMKLAEQGSTVLAVPALRRAIRMAGRENVYFVAFEENRFILDAMELIPRENVLTISTERVSSMAFGFLGLVRRMRRLRLDAVVDLEFFARFSAALTYLSGSPLRVGLHGYYGEGPDRGDLMTHRVLYNPQFHTVHLFDALVEALDHDPGQFPAYPYVPPLEDAIDFPRFSFTDGEKSELLEILVQAGVDPAGKPLVLLNANASDLIALRKWPRYNYLDLANRIMHTYPDAQVLLTGGPEEREQTEQMAAELNHPRCRALGGRTTLRQLLILYSLADLLITNDSGPAHFATLTPIRVITLFGPESPNLFSAPTARNTALYAGLACSPCVSALNNRQSACTNNLCMQAITVDQVLAEVARHLAPPGSRE